MNKKILIIVFLLLIPISFSQGEDPCIIDPTDTNCFENFEIILPGDVVEDVEGPDVLEEPSMNGAENEMTNEEKGFFSSWIFLVLVVLFILIIIVILYIYLKNKNDNSEYNSEDSSGYNTEDNSGYSSNDGQGF
ncbi:MAG: hypothetical protein KKG75_03035 [Nanoarchaeota archaeon]|nr:hypothetical protein [Nanoarchaeota archaeon]